MMQVVSYTYAASGVNRNVVSCGDACRYVARYSHTSRLRLWLAVSHFHVHLVGRPCRHGITVDVRIVRTVAALVVVVAVQKDVTTCAAWPAPAFVEEQAKRLLVLFL